MFSQRKAEPKLKSGGTSRSNNRYGKRRICLADYNLLRNTRIQTRLIVSFLLLSFVPLLVTGIVSFNKSSNAIDSKISTSSVQVTKQLSQNIRQEMDKFRRISDELGFNETVHKNLSEFSRLEETEKMDFLNFMNMQLANTFASTKNIAAACIIISDGTLISYGNPPDFESEFYSAILMKADERKGVPGWDLNADAESDSNHIIFSRTINSISLSKRLATIFVLIDEKNFSDIYSDMDLGTGSDIFILDSDGIVVSGINPEIGFGREYGNKSLLEGLERQEDSGSFMLRDQLVVFSSIEDSQWVIVGTIPTQYLNSESKSLRNTIISFGFICLILAFGTSYIISRSISIPLKNLIGLMKEAKSGNLTIGITDSNKDEIGNMLSHFNDMVANVRRLILNIRESNEKVLSNIEKMAISAESSFNASQQITNTIQEVAKGVEQQASEATDCVFQMGNLSTRLITVGADMNEVSGVVQDTGDLSKVALETVKFLNEKTAETSSASERIIGDINSLNEDMKQIKDIVKVIVGITEQTNLLSLNAAIEASRAGEAGRGFAVVAEEVRKLAEQSKDASVMINNIINNILRKTEHAVIAANKAKSIINEEVEAVHKTNRSFQTIYEAMNRITEHMAGTEKAVKDSLEYKDKTMSSIESISAISQETASCIEEVAASTEEQMAESEQLSVFAKELNELAQKMNGDISVFTV